LLSQPPQLAIAVRARDELHAIIAALSALPQRDDSGMVEALAAKIRRLCSYGFPNEPESFLKRQDVLDELAKAAQAKAGAL
jgi:hypothetical protein